MLDRGQIFLPEEVLVELAEKTDAVYNFFRENNRWVVDLDLDQIQGARYIINKYPNMVNVHTSKNSADPFVVALAKIRGSKVITEEQVKTEDQLKLPNVCRWNGIQAISFLEFLDEQGWGL